MLEKVQDSLAVDWVVWSMRWVWLALLLLLTLFNPVREDLSLAFLLLGGAAAYNLTLVLLLYFKLFPPGLSYLTSLVDVLFLVAFLYASGEGTGPLVLFSLFPVLVVGIRYDVITSLSIAIIPVLVSGIFYFLEWYGTGQTGNPYSLVVNLTVFLLTAALSSLVSGKEREVIQNLQAARTRQAIERKFNPYQAGGPVEVKMFFGREEALAEVLDTIHNNHVAIYGERRIGKTSLLHQLDNRLREMKDLEYLFIPAFFSLQGVPAKRLFYTLMVAIARSCQPHIGSLDLIYATKKEGYDAYDLVDDLETVLEALEAITDKQIRLVLLLDEGDELNGYDPIVQARLRRVLMSKAGQRLRMVWSGLYIDKEWELDTSPWYNLFAIEKQVPPFTREEALRLIQEPVKGIYRYDKDAIELILQDSERKPFRIQQICLATINRVLAQKRRRVTGPIQVTKEDVERAYQGLVAGEAIVREAEERGKVGLLETQVAEGGAEYQVNTDGQGDQ